MAASHISSVRGQFNYFDAQLGHPDWTGKRVLDFDGNVGNIPLDPGCTIEPRNYWSIDVSRDAIIEGGRRHANGHFVFYDRYNRAFNPTGTVGLPIPDPGVTFDFIPGHSVFTHVSKAETLEYADRLLEFLMARRPSPSSTRGGRRRRDGPTNSPTPSHGHRACAICSGSRMGRSSTP